MVTKNNDVSPEIAKPTLLYVDDDRSNIVVMEMRLEEHYDIISATSDKEACALLRTRGHGLSLVLMDIQLVGSQLDGVALTRLIRGTCAASQRPAFAKDVPVRADLPIIFVTAFGEQHDLNTLFEAGGSAVIAKPVDFVKLSRAITRHHLKGVLDARG
jgi:two-component system sensor histidine kinase BarA